MPVLVPPLSEYMISLYTVRFFTFKYLGVLIIGFISLVLRKKSLSKVSLLQA